MVTRDSKGRFVSKGNGRSTLSVNQFVERLVDNAAYSIATRARLAKTMGDPRRDIDDECGYPKTDRLTFTDYKDMYDRELGARVVEIYPDECWSVSPSVYEDSDPKVNTPFEKAWDELGKSLRSRGEYRQEKGSAIWRYLHRVDVMSGIGRYGVLLLGIEGDGNLEEEAKPKDGNKLAYLRCFDEGSAEIVQWVDDDGDRRNGLPLMYNLTSGEGANQKTRKCHWTRVIHVAECLQGSEVFARPRQQVCWNRLYDLKKTYGAAGQGYWDAGVPFRTIESHPQYGDIEWPNDLKEQIEKVITGLQRWMALKAVTLKTHAPGVLSPGPFVDAAIEAICILIDCPVRIFRGSERGELASSQDAVKWYGTTLPGRQNLYLTPDLIAEFVNRLLWLKMLPMPANGYYIEWPEMIKMRPDEQAAVAERRMKAMAAFVQSGASELIPEIVFLTKELGYEDDEARDALEEAMPKDEFPADAEVMEEEGADDEQA